MALTQIKASNIEDGTVVAAEIGADAIDGTKLADNAINSEHYTDGSIDNAHLADDAVGVAELSATGTASSSTFLRGDNSWVAAGSTSASDLTSGTLPDARIAANAITLAKMAGGTDGQIITYDASGDPVAVGPGTDGQVLTSTGAGSPPAFESAAPGSVGRHTMWIPASAMLSKRTNGCSSLQRFQTSGAAAGGNPDIQSLNFGGSVDQHACFQVAFPKSWNEGTITYRVFWAVTDTAATDGSDTVSWALSAVSRADDASIDQAYGTKIAITEATSGTVEDIAISAESATLTVSQAAVDTMTFFLVTRDVSADTMAEEACLIGIQIFLTTESGTDA